MDESLITECLQGLKALTSSYYGISNQIYVERLAGMGITGGTLATLLNVILRYFNSSNSSNNIQIASVYVTFALNVVRF